MVCKRQILISKLVWATDFGFLVDEFDVRKSEIGDQIDNNLVGL
jgi:hypothetical protein